MTLLSTRIGLEVLIFGNFVPIIVARPQPYKSFCSIKWNLVFCETIWVTFL